MIVALAVDPPPWAGKQFLATFYYFFIIGISPYECLSYVHRVVNVVSKHGYGHTDLRMLFADDILMKLDQLLLAVNKPLIEPGVASVIPTSTKTEDHVVDVDDSPINGSTIKAAKDGSSLNLRVDSGKNRGESRKFVWALSLWSPNKQDLGGINVLANSF